LSNEDRRPGRGAFASDAKGGTLVFGVGVFVYQWVFRCPAAREMASTRPIAGEPAGLAPDLIGKCGMTASPLRPAERVTVDDQQYDAESEMGFIEAHEKVEVLATKDTRLVVRRT
jgi:membrane-bound ClpP family serine protease